MLWLSALVTDGMAMTQGTYTCEKSWKNSTTTCDSSAYGITLALDALLFVILLFCWYIVRSVLQNTDRATNDKNSYDNTV